MTTHEPRTVTGSPGRKLNRAVLLGNLLAGALWVLVLMAMDAWPLAVIGGVYVVVASIYLAVVQAPSPLLGAGPPRAWLLPWLGAVALWVVLLGAIEAEHTATRYGISLIAGLWVGSMCFVVWQVLGVATEKFLVVGRRSLQRS